MTRLEDFNPLRSAEVVLLRAYQTGEIAKVGLRRPLVPTIETTVRGEFVSFLARGGDADRAGRRIQLVGAWIEGRIDLRNAVVDEGLWFYRCVMDATPRLDGAHIGGSVSFPDCLLPGFRAESCTFAGNLALNSGCTVRNEVRLAGATIGRDLNCERLRLRSSERSTSSPVRRLSADGAQIAGDAILAGGFEAQGGIRLVGARINGDLRVDNARLSGSIDSEGVRGDALNLDQMRVAGKVSLDQGFAAAGAVRLKQARIDGDLDCNGAAFDVFGDMGLSGCATLLLDRAKVGGSLVLTRMKRPLLGASLAGTQVGALHDDLSTWGGRLVLDGFSYARFADGAPTAARFRMSWLGQQERAHLRKDFRPQPWRQLITVLSSMGHHDDARVIAVKREAHLRRVGRLGTGMPRGLRWLPSLGHRLYGLFAGYGYRPWRLVASMVMLWLVCSAVYWAAAERGVMAPTDPLVFNDPRYAHCRPDAASTRYARIGEVAVRNWTRCAELPAEFPPFRPFAYSLDLLLPLVDLRQDQQWAALSGTRAGAGSAGSPAIDWGVVTHMLSWFEIVFGWAATLTLLALVAGRTRGDREPV
jgi:hypothetical protein